MRRVFTIALIFCAGALAGWWLRDQRLPGHDTVLAETVADEIPSEGRLGTNHASGPAPVAEAVAVASAGDLPRDGAALEQQFRELLEEQEFEQAAVFYENAVRQDATYQTLLRPVLDAYTEACLEQCAQGVFTALADTWLNRYYDDIPMLLQLAQYQRHQGFFEEAANVLNRAMTYAYAPVQRARVVRALGQLVQSTDDFFSEQQRWIELLGFYEYLDAIALTEPAFRLRQATIYQLLGETGDARTLLLALQADDDGLDPQWTRAVAEQLQGITPAAKPETVPPTAIPLVRHGDHFLVEAALNDRQRVRLILDTGASVTSLSRSSFTRLDSGRFHYLGSRLFNTANGMATGEMYRADVIALGDNRVNDVDIAVLDYESSDGTDGLLGMNVLRHYGFSIDQESGLLYLRPR